MGACVSSAGDSIHKSASAIVISVDGDLNSYPTPIFVSEVLHKPSFFLCNSDELYYDQHINALDLEDQLDAAQIYFVLPNTMLGRRLSASDMAALAVKASLALDSSADSPKKKNNNKARISPMVLMESTEINKNVGSLRVSKSRSIRKIQRRSSSKKGRVGVGSFRLQLSTIYENDGCDELQVI